MADKDPPRSGTAAGIIASVFAFIGDSPWKAFFIIFACLCGAIGWVLYENRQAIVESWLTPSAPSLKTELVTGALDKLAQDTDADLVQVWSIDLSANSQHFFAARRRDGERPVIPTPRRLPIITTTSDAKALVEVLNGTPVCIDISTAGTPLAERLAHRGMKRGCAIPIPPTSEAFVGVIYLAWLTAPEAKAETVAVGVARDIARTLATR